MLKYKLTDETKVINGTVLHRIVGGDSGSDCKAKANGPTD